MKKFITMLMSLALVPCMTIPAFAATQIVNVSIPVKDYSYTMVIPKDCTITYGDTSYQSIGEVTITSDNWDDILSDYEEVSLMIDNGGNKMTNENGRTIQAMKLAGYSRDNMVNTGGLGFTEDGVAYMGVYVPDWSSAEAGTTYTMTFTYTAYLMEKMDHGIAED